MTDLPQRRALMTAALGFRLLNLNDAAARTLATWMDTWMGVGAVVTGMVRQEYEVVLTGGPDGWTASFFQQRLVGGAPEVVGAAHAEVPWRAVQKSAWGALERQTWPT